MIVTFEPKIEEINGPFVDLVRRSLSETESVHQKFTLAGSSTDADVFPSQLTTIDVLVLSSNIATTYKLNSSATAIPLDASGVHVLWGTAVTAITMSEAAGTDATIQLWAWGA
jgi:hypothetical protein